LVAYLKASSGEPNYALVTDLLEFVYRANRQVSLDQRALEKQVQRFAKRPGTIIPQLIEEHTFEWAKSGELKKDLLACFPGEIFRKKRCAPSAPAQSALFRPPAPTSIS
jgi:hypothetical protein